MDDQTSITNTALNYIEGWYQANKGRMQRALHPKLVKRRFVSNKKIWKVDTPWMLQATNEGQGRLPDPEGGNIDIKILDIAGNIASVKIVSVKFIDYIHMVKIDEKWVIVDVLWEFVV